MIWVKVSALTRLKHLAEEGDLLADIMISMVKPFLEKAQLKYNKPNVDDVWVQADVPEDVLKRAIQEGYFYSSDVKFSRR